MNKIPLLLLGTILFTNIITSQQWLYISASMVSTQHTAHSTQHTAHSTQDRTAQYSRPHSSMQRSCSEQHGSSSLQRRAACRGNGEAPERRLYRTDSPAQRNFFSDC